jgi:hypothetical protein
MTTDEHIISTSTAHPIRLQANRLNSAVSALTIDTTNQSVFGAPVGILKDPSTELDVNGGIACSSLDASGSVAGASVEADVFAPRIPGPIYFTDKNGNTILTLGTSLNSFLRGISTPSLVIAGTDVLSAINARQLALDDTSVVSVDSLTTSSGITTSSITAPSGELDVGGTVACSSLDVSGEVKCSDVTVTSAVAGDAPVIRAKNTSGGGFASLFLQSAGIVAQQFVGAGAFTIGTQTQHHIRIMADRFNAGAVALQINTDATAEFGSDTSVAGALTVQGRNVLNDIDGKQATLSSLAGTGETLTNDSSTLRRIFGEGGVTVDIPINNADSTKDFQLRVSGQALQNQIDILTQRVEALEAA